MQPGPTPWGSVTVLSLQPGLPGPKPNYAFEKRQRELEKKRKKEEKAQKKSTGPAQQPGADETGATEPSPPGTPRAP